MNQLQHFQVTHATRPGWIDDMDVMEKVLDLIPEAKLPPVPQEITVAEAAHRGRIRVGQQTHRIIKGLPLMTEFENAAKE